MRTMGDTDNVKSGGERACPHTSFRMARRMGRFHIEDYVCTSCGGLLTEEDVRKIKERRVRAYFRDVSDNVIRINDLVDTLRFREVKSEE